MIVKSDLKKRRMNSKNGNQSLLLESISFHLGRVLISSSLNLQMHFCLLKIWAISEAIGTNQEISLFFKTPTQPTIKYISHTICTKMDWLEKISTLWVLLGRVQLDSYNFRVWVRRQKFKRNKELIYSFHHQFYKEPQKR